MQLTHTDSNGLVPRLSSVAQKWLYRQLDSLVGLARTALSDTAKDQLKRLFPRLRERVASQILFSGVDWSTTRAYHTAEFPGSIRVNLKGREVNGIVEPGAEYEVVCETIQSELKAAIADPLIEDFSADLRDGYILVSAQRRRLSGDKTDTLSFRLDLGVNDGRLTAAISEAQINGIPIEEERLKLWNERIANRLARAGQRNPNSTLQTVSVTQDSVTMAWRVETERSRSG